MYLSLTKTLLYATKDSCLPHLHCKGEAKKKECGRQKEGRSAGDSFRRFSRRILSATPGARIRIRSGVAAGSVDFEHAGALGNGKFVLRVGLATALPSVIIPCTTHRRLYSFSKSVTPLPSFPVRFCSSTMFPLVVSTCVSPAVVPPGAKVALQQSSSSTSFAISLESSTQSTCRSSYSLLNDCSMLVA